MKLAHNYFDYILQCNDGFYYTRITNDLDRRLNEHNEGYIPTCFTFKRRPVHLKYFEQYAEVTQAIQREKQLKGWSRAKKEALFAQDFDLLKELAKSTAGKERLRALKGANVDNLRTNPSESSG